MQEPDRAPDRMAELPPEVRKFLASLRDEELKTFREIVKLPADDIKEGFRFVRELKTVGRFTRWLILTIVGVFIGTMVFIDYILKAWSLIRGSPNP